MTKPVFWKNPKNRFYLVFGGFSDYKRVFALLSFPLLGRLSMNKAADLIIGLNCTSETSRSPPGIPQAAASAMADVEQEHELHKVTGIPTSVSLFLSGQMKSSPLEIWPQGPVLDVLSKASLISY